MDTLSHPAIAAPLSPSTRVHLGSVAVNRCITLSSAVLAVACTAQGKSKAKGSARTAGFFPCLPLGRSYISLYSNWFLGLSFTVNVRQFIACLCVALGLFTTTVYADPFQDIVTLAEQGSPALALHLMAQQQNSAASDWAAWEKARILIYQQRRDWPSLVRRVQTLVASGILYCPWMDECHERRMRLSDPLAILAPDNLPLAFVHWALAQGAAAQLELGQGAAAREWLLRLIWEPASINSSLSVESHTLSQWRRMVIHSYIVDGRVDDAYTAMLRYQQDYGEADTQTRLLQAHVLLLVGRAAEAAVLLADAQEPAGGSHSSMHPPQLSGFGNCSLRCPTVVPSARALYLLARLRSDGGRPENILQQANQLAQQHMTTKPLEATARDGGSAGNAGAVLPPTDTCSSATAPGVPSASTSDVHGCRNVAMAGCDRGVMQSGAVLAWAVQAEAAQLIGEHERRVEALEYMLAGREGAVATALGATNGLFNVSSDSVWDAYMAYAQVLSNQQQLLMGDFEPWFVAAQSVAKEHPIRARALFAFLTTQADTVETRVRAHQQLITLLGQHAQGAVLVRALYVSLDRF